MERNCPHGARFVPSNSSARESASASSSHFLWQTECLHCITDCEISVTDAAQGVCLWADKSSVISRPLKTLAQSRQPGDAGLNRCIFTPAKALYYLGFTYTKVCVE